MKILEVRDFPDNPCPIYGDETLIRVRRRFLFWTWEETYVGGGTVWCKYPAGGPASDAMGIVLGDIEQRRMWKKYQ